MVAQNKRKLFRAHARVFGASWIKQWAQGLGAKDPWTHCTGNQYFVELYILPNIDTFCACTYLYKSLWLLALQKGFLQFNVYCYKLLEFMTDILQTCSTIYLLALQHACIHNYYDLRSVVDCTVWPQPAIVLVALPFNV